MTSSSLGSIGEILLSKQSLTSPNHTRNLIFHSLCDKSLFQKNPLCPICKQKCKHSTLCLFCGNQVCKAHLNKTRPDPQKPQKRHKICYLCDKYYVQQILFNEFEESMSMLKERNKVLRKKQEEQ